MTTPPRDVSDVALPLATPITARPVQTAPVCKIRADSQKRDEISILLGCQFQFEYENEKLNKNSTRGSSIKLTAKRLARQSAQPTKRVT